MRRNDTTAGCHGRGCRHLHPRVRSYFFQFIFLVNKDSNDYFASRQCKGWTLVCMDIDANIVREQCNLDWWNERHSNIKMDLLFWKISLSGFVIRAETVITALTFSIPFMK
jgi:hypothetical protein